MQIDVVGQVEASQLSLGTPCPGWTVRQVMDHSVGVTLKFADFAAGTMDAPRRPPGELIGIDYRQVLRAAASASQKAWAQADMARSCRLAFGTFSADAAMGINLFDVLAHTWDIAIATGVNVENDDDLWTAGLVAAQLVIGPHRDESQYGPEIPVSALATARRRFLAFVGRCDR
jgi:uncharacterized protein (TIGR03086 family)